MSASENSQEQNLPEKEEFFDAIRRHICQALGFDFVFVDFVREPEIVNLISFSAEDEDKEAREFVDTLSDENQQPLTTANTHVAQNVKKTQGPWIGKAFMASSAVQADRESDLDDDDDELDALSAEKEGYPYSIVPIVQAPHGNTGTVRGLIRVLSFDPTREITQQDLATLKLMGEHLSTKMSQFAPGSEAQPAEANRVAFDSEYVLVVHTNRLVRRRYSRILGEKFQVIEADSGDKALDALQNNRVDLIVLDSEIKGKSGYAFCRVLKESNQFKHVPVILVTSDTNPTARVDGLNVGADDCLSESCFDSELLARVKSSMRHRKTERELAIQLQLLEDYAQRLEQATEHLSQDKQLQLKRNRELELLRWESDILRSQDTLLHRISNTIRQSFNITENLHKMLEAFSGWFNLDCCFVVLPSEDEPEDSIRTEYYADEEYQLMKQDVDLRTLEVFKQHFQGEQLLMANDAAHDRRLEPFRKDALPNYHFFSLFFVPITYEQKLLGLLGGYKCESQANWNRDNEAFLKSVADQVATGVTNARLYARVQRQATTDGLTGLYNHRTGQEKLAEQLRLAERYQRNLAVVMLDVDHFKSINDNYGHPAGDSVLKAAAKLVKSDCRDVDLPVRYGGEEFLLVLPEVNQEGAAVVAERIRKNLSQEVIYHEGIQISVTASFGIAAFPEDAHNQQQLLDLADKALYLSKRLGRNQVHTAGDLMFEEISPSKLPEPKPDARTQRRDDGEKPETAKGAEGAEDSSDDTGASEPSAVPSSSLFTLPANTYADFVPTAVSAAAEQKEELVPEVVEMVKALATALYSKSDYNKQHHLETARLSELLAKVMGLSQQQVEQIRVAGLLHDVGTLSIPADLMNKPGKYNADEREIINQHAVLGAQLLRPIRALRDICEILENHHERWDGLGYPRGLKGEEIPLPARIVAIVDSYHAMISDRPYRDAMSREEAIQTLKKGAGLQWDPFLVDIFVAVLASLNDPRSAPLSAPTPVVPKVEALNNEPPKLVAAPEPDSSDASSPDGAKDVGNRIDDRSESDDDDEQSEVENAGADRGEGDSSARESGDEQSPVLNARQRLMQHSQQHEPLQVPKHGARDLFAPEPSPVSEQAPQSAADTSETLDAISPQEIAARIALSSNAGAGASNETGHKENALDEEDDFEDDDLEDDTAQVGHESKDLVHPDVVNSRSEITGARPAPPSALEQLRRIPPEQQAAMFHQASQRAASEQGAQQAGQPTPPQQPMPQQASPQQLSPQQQIPQQQVPQQNPQQQLPQQQVPQQPAPQPATPQTEQQPQNPLPAVQSASAHFFQPKTAVPTPQQHSPATSAPQPVLQRPMPGQNVSQPLPQQPAPGQNISQQLPQQPAPGQNISQPLPQQPAPGQNISQQLPQQPNPMQPQAPRPMLQPTQPQAMPPSMPQPMQQQSTQPQVMPQQAPRQAPQQPPPLPVPQQPQQPPSAHNLFPHMQQMQNVNTQSQSQPPQNPAAQQQYAPQNPGYTTAPQPMTPTNPLAPQERPNQPPATPTEQEQKRKSPAEQLFEDT